MKPIILFDYMFLTNDVRINLTKDSEHPEFMRQLALEVIGDIPDQALKVCMEAKWNLGELEVTWFTEIFIAHEIKSFII
ncbi:hypothetical protein HNY73_013138 [Argiope bruennichi]|uniref:Uncharacterized protein n=1 Tax=Argiope bruennichi TaxID=94029 RepID=A0A8T0EX29_ARGBR|nr:hypothetical protein HNY73_013138 [Argiope bruennichi]